MNAPGVMTPDNKVVYTEGNFSILRPVKENSNFKPLTIMVDSIFVDGAFINYAQDFLNLLMQRYSVFVACWNNNIDQKARNFGKDDYARCLANGVEAAKVYSGRDRVELLVTYSSGLGIALCASDEKTLGIKNIGIIGTPYSFFGVPWADYYRNYRLVFEDDLIELGWKHGGVIKGSEIDDRFEWMDKKYGILMGKSPHDMFNTGKNYKHVDMPVKAYSDWMDMVRYNSLESKNLCFENEDVDYAVVLYGYKDYMTNNSTSILPLLTRLNMGANIISIGSDLGHRELLDIRAFRHHQSLIDFLQN